MSGDFGKILVTGSYGQIGSELTPRLRELYGKENVIASGRKVPSVDRGPFEILDVNNIKRLDEVVVEHDVEVIIHLAALLSASGEKNPNLAWHVNIDGLYNVLEVAKNRKLKRVFNPSSIAVFGPETPRDKTPQETVMKPRTMYGVTKVTGELLGDYYNHKWGVDVRGIRFPGIISNVAPPGGGTTDYAVEIFYEAIQNGQYTCFLRADSTLPMMYMPDCLKGVVQLLETDLSRLKHHTDFNMSAISFSPAELVVEIRRHMPEFKVEYKPDFRQAIADSWPKSIDDSIARKEWGWKPDYDLKAMVGDMLKVLGSRLRKTE
ncbi:TPA: NAD-dependent epimerase/dehydratase family protein [Candidatus Bathyarchaeota archaeon]|nr:NAD-dependent epimerase/dehydratase family protein [Candidatus Bathyarchaeota archaeon]